MGDGRTFSIEKKGEGERIRSVRCGSRRIDGWFVGHDDLADRGLVINAVPSGY